MAESPVSASSVSGNSAAGISDSKWDEIFDVVVVGSGGGALTSALLAARGGASTLVVEKDEFFGGTTAVSGGDMWIPNNRFVKDRDSREDALKYIRRLSDGRYQVDDDVFVELRLAAPVSPVRLRWRGADYDITVPGEVELPAFLTVEGVDEPPSGELVLVLQRKGGWLRLFQKPRVYRAVVEARRVPG